jgi:serine/threonine protein kinase
VWIAAQYISEHQQHNMGNKLQKAREREGEGKGAESAEPTAAPSSPTNAGADEPAEDVDISPELSQQNNKPLTVEDFELLKVLGKGSFGKVMLVRYRGDGQLYAMKTLRKAALVKRNQLGHTATERTILQSIRNPFLVRLNFAFQTPDKLYMVLDYMAGGELFFWLKKDRKFRESRARLYAAEIALALACLHSHDIIYRDLKPENILLDAQGHLRLTDFGLSKDGVTGAGAEGGTHTFCGTPEYLAPEILQQKGHGKAVDWWSLGTLLYEMMCGLPPFYDTNIQRMYNKILQSPLRLPAHLSDPAKEVLTGLLERKVNERLGSGAGDVEELKRTAFFSALDFDRVYNREYTPEFIPPPMSSDTDVGNFDAEFTSERAMDSVVDTSMSVSNAANFEGFTFRGDTNMNGSS